MAFGESTRVSSWLLDVKDEVNFFTIVDYILFATLDVDLELNPNEVSDARYVSKDELEAMFSDSSESFDVLGGSD
jgi:isopentenyldiphosphate isomerase